MTNLTEELNKPLELEVKWVNKGAGREFAYLSGESVICELNKVFGYAGWDYVIKKHEMKIERDSGTTSCIALCDVELIVWFEDGDTRMSCTKSGSAASCHSARDTGGLDRACHVAYTDAETTALKRAAVKLGSRFGLDLYDKNETWKVDYYVPEETIKDTYRWLEEQHPGLAEPIWKRSQRVSGLTNPMVPRASWDSFKEALNESRKVLDPQKNGNSKPNSTTRSKKLTAQIRGGNDA